MKLKPALTLVELVMVLGLIAVFTVPVVLSVTGFRSRYALKSSGENLSNTVRTVRVYAREERDEKSWGIRYVDANTYAIISGQPSSFSVDNTYKLHTPAQFPNSFSDIWFFQGRSETDKNYTIRIRIPSGTYGEVQINKSGVVKYVGP